MENNIRYLFREVYHITQATLAEDVTRRCKADGTGYRRYTGSIVMDCLKACVQKFQDGFLRCGIGENIDCEKCYAEFMERIEE